jgi:hypothetical protein
MRPLRRLGVWSSRGDLGAIVDVYTPEAFEVEFVSASGQEQTLVTLKASDIRAANDRDQVSVRPRT